MNMLANCFRAQAEGQPPFGRSADGRNVFVSFRPSVIQFAQLVTPFLDETATSCDVLPISKGFTLSKCAANDQLQLSLSDVYTRRMRMLYGYVVEIKLS